MYSRSLLLTIAAASLLAFGSHAVAQTANAAALAQAPLVAANGNPAAIGMYVKPMADAVMQRATKSSAAPTWDYSLGTELNGLDAAWYTTGNGDYIRFIKQTVDKLVDDDGNIHGYKREDYTLDSIQMGRQLLLLYRVFQTPKYYKAAVKLREQLSSQPRTPQGGFWHKQRYPNQMWLDGLYMAEPFYAEYAMLFHEPKDFDDITHQFVLAEEHTRDAKTGLLYHAWDASPSGKKQAWADAATGHSKIFWSRAMGWYAMALVETIPYYPATSPDRAKLIAILNRLATAVVKQQDPTSGLWYQVTDQPKGAGNYLEASSSAMFSYALLKGVREGWLPVSYQKNGEHAFNGLLQHFISTDTNDGGWDFTGTVAGVGLGRSSDTGPYRDGTYQYYVGEKQAVNDPKGIGAFLMAASEMQLAPESMDGRGKTVLLDAWFNSQKQKDITGQMVYYHYKWDDMANSGFNFLGRMFQARGANLDTLYVAPTAKNLAGASVFIIASPDIPVKNPKPNYMQPADADAIAAWVKAGGVLVMMENDVNNSDFTHFNLLADKFGLHFNPVMRNAVPGVPPVEEMGEVDLQPDSVFAFPHIAFMKEICTISPTGNAKAVFTDTGDVLIATAKYGKGTVIALPDPWLYDEYTDGRKPPPPFNNYAAGDDLVHWIMEQVAAAHTVKTSTH